MAFSTGILDGLRFSASKSHTPRWRALMAMHAEDIMRLVRNGNDWVRLTLNIKDFSTDDEDAVNRKAEIELPV